MRAIETELPGVLIIEPRVFHDPRGFFLETYSARRYAEAGLPESFVQDNHSRSAPGTLRGLHYQLRQPQAKLVRCIRGALFDVAVDVRRGSPTFARWIGVELTALNMRQLFIPPGFAHGFCVGAEESEMEYKCSDYYAPEDEIGIIWNDPTLNIEWPIENPVLSAKDSQFGTLSAVGDNLPLYEGA